MILGGSRDIYMRSVLTETPVTNTSLGGNIKNVFGDNKFADWESGKLIIVFLFCKKIIKLFRMLLKKTWNAVCALKCIITLIIAGYSKPKCLRRMKNY